MGNSKTKIQIISYEEAEKSVTPKELSRLKIAFNQHEKNGLLYFDKFHSELFGSFLPYSISELIFKSLKSNSNYNGITFKEYLVFLVILTKGSYEDMCKLIYNIYCNESGTGVDFMDLQRSADASHTYRDEIRSARKFTNENQVINQESFMYWISKHPCFNQLSEWLLSDFCDNNNNEPIKTSRLQLSDDTGPPDLYQLVAGITHLNEKEIIDLEKTYRRLLSKPPNKLNLEKFTEITSVYIPHEMISDLFNILDEDSDGIVDIKELACGISACTRGPETERQKFCCKIFDTDKDGCLDIDDFSRIYEMCLKCHIPLMENDDWINNGSTKFRSLITSADLESGSKISVDELVIWLIENDFIDPLMELLNEVFVIIFGLRPETKSEEIRLISSWIEREEQLLTMPFVAPTSVSIISADWWNQWINENQIHYGPTQPPSSTQIINNSGNKVIPPQLKRLRNVNHSLSMNNLFSMPPKRSHHYDLLQRSRSSKDKLGNGYGVTSGTESSTTAGKYTLTENCFNTTNSSLQNSTSSIEPSPNRVYPIICSPSSVRYRLINSARNHCNSNTPDQWSSYNNSTTSSINSNLAQSFTNNASSTTTNSNPIEIMYDHYKVQIDRFAVPINNRLLLSNNATSNNANNSNNKSSHNLSNLTDISSNAESRWSLSPNMRLNLDYHIIPVSVWNCLLSWYKGGPSLNCPIFSVCDNVPNKPYLSLLLAQNAGHESNPSLIFYTKQYKQDVIVVIVELVLLNLFIAVHTINSNNSTTSTTSNESSTSSNLIPNIASTFIPYIASTATNSNIASLNQIRRQVKYRITISRACHLTDLLTQFAQKLSLQLDEIRIWRMSIEQTGVTKTSSGSSGASFVLLDEDEDEQQDDDDNDYHNTTHKKPLFMFQFKDGDKVLLEQRNTDLTWPEELSQFAQIKSLSNKRASTKKGVTGLSNMGNSCFFNSAVQCISNCCPLTDYFQRGLHLTEVNKNNSKGCNGLLATKYGELIKDIWSGSTSLIVPIKLKVSLQKYTRQFSDNQQHDAQELLCALLDGLHEDLNRVKTKPQYQELKDSDDRDDIEVANEAWRNHLAHNQSIIVDLFHGLLKSSVICDSCSNKSVRFDAFSILSLPIPVETKELVDITVLSSDVGLSTASSLVTVPIPIAEPTVNAALDQLTSKLNIPRRNICLAIVDFNTHKIQKFLDGNDRISKMKKYYAFHFEPDPNDEENNNSFVYFVFYNRKLILKTNYIVAQTRLVPEVFGEPIVKRVSRSKLRIIKQPDDNSHVVGGGNCNIVTNRDLYNLLNPLFSTSTQNSNQTNGTNETGANIENSLHSSLKLNHAIDCDQKSLFQPYVLSKIDSSSLKCSDCHWSKFCHGCIILPNDSPYDNATSTKEAHYLAVDWTIATLHLKQYSEIRNNYFDSTKPPSLHASFSYNSSSKSTSESWKQQSLDLFQCLEEFVAQESLGKDTPYQCCKCKQATSAHKKLDLWNLPPILIIHLKRFQYVNKRWQKSNRFVEFQSPYLDLSKFVVGNNDLSSSSVHQPTTEPVNGHGDIDDTNCTDSNHSSRSKYRLFAVNCHLGNIQMGHYITYARNRHTDKWFLFNDGICKEVNESEVMNTNAYLLFYQQINFNSDNLLDEIIETTMKSNSTNGATVNNGTVLPATEVAIGDSDDEPSDGDYKKYCNLQ